MKYLSFLNKLKTPFRKLARLFLICWFCITFLMFILSFTTLPFWGIYNLARAGADYEFSPDYIVLMGGSGMPGKSSLIRAYYTAELYKDNPYAKVIVALPDDTTKENNQLLRMQKELMIRGIDSANIIFEPIGTNSRSQAINIKDNFIENLDKKIVIVTSPEHVYRSVNCFEKMGYSNVGSLACFESDLKISLDFESEKIGGKRYIPDVGDSQQLRYQFWNHLKYEITLLREYFAIAYYKLQGWI